MHLDIPSRQTSVDPTSVELPSTPIGAPSTATGEPKVEEPSKMEDEQSGSSITTKEIPSPAKEEEVKTSNPPRIGFIYTCPTASTVKWRMMYSVNVGNVVREAEERCGVKVEKKVSRP